MTLMRGKIVSPRRHIPVAAGTSMVSCAWQSDSPASQRYINPPTRTDLGGTPSIYSATQPSPASTGGV